MPGRRKKSPRRHPGRFAIGCDLGGTTIKIGAVTPAGDVLAHSRQTTHGDRPGGEIAERIIDSIERLREEGNLRRSGLAGIGIALPGIIDENRARPVFLSRIPGLNGYPLRRRIARAVGLPVILETDTNAGCLGEALFGNARGFERVLYITLGSGVGAAMVARGEPVRAVHHTLAHVAHMELEPGGPTCLCGARGCVEAVLAADAIASRAMKTLRRRSSKKDARLCGLHGGVSPEGVYRAACRGSPWAREVLAETGTLLARLAYNLARLFSPDMIIVGGGISRAHRFILRPARQRLRGMCRIAPAALGGLAGITGAASIIHGLGRTRSSPAAKCLSHNSREPRRADLRPRPRSEEEEC